MGGAAYEVETVLAEALPEGERGIEIVAGTIEDIDTKPVGLLLGLANQSGIAPEIAKRASADTSFIQARAMPQNIVRELVRQHSRQLLVISNKPGKSDRYADILAICIRAEPLSGHGLKSARATLFSTERDDLLRPIPPDA